MKKTLLVMLCALMISLGANAQVRFGVRGGLAMTKISMDPDLGLDLKFFTGFKAGGLFAIEIPGGLELETGLFYSQNGIKTEGVLEGFPIESSTNLNYINVPLKLNYLIGAGPATIIIGAGPTLSYGFGGKSEITTTIGGTERIDVMDVRWGNNPDDFFKHLSIGLNFQAGVRFSMFQVSASYGMGLNNISPVVNETIRFNSIVGLSVAYMF